MREKPKDPIRLKHIKDACEKLLSKSPEEWRELARQDAVIFYGLVKLTEIIGEAAYYFTKEFKANHPATHWPGIEVMRHYLVHEYYQIKEEDFWSTLSDDIKPLLGQINNYLDEFQ